MHGNSNAECTRPLLSNKSRKVGSQTADETMRWQCYNGEEQRENVG